MATGGGYGRSTPHGSSSSINRNDSFNDHSLGRFNNNHPQNRTSVQGSQQSIDLDGMTLNVVDEFKQIVQNKVGRQEQLTQPIIELEVVKIKREKDSSRYNMDQWKRQLSRDVQNCPDSILRVSMAYGDDPRQIQSVIQTKMNEIHSTEDPVDASFNNVSESLRQLRNELEVNPMKNLFRAIHNINGSDTNRAVRLFLSEAHHFAPGLSNYTYEDAENAVRAIREANYVSENTDDLIAILKTCRGLDDIREYLNKDVSKTSTQRTDSTTARFTDNTRHSNPDYLHNSQARANNNTSTGFSHRSSPYSNQNSTQTPDRSLPRPSNTSRNESHGSPLRRDFD